MAVNAAAGSKASPVQSGFSVSLRDVLAGSVTSILAVAYGLSFGALIFSGPLTPWLAYGIAASFITSAIGAAIVAARSSLPFMIAGPDGATAAVTATLVSALAQQLVSSGTTANLYQPVLIVMGLSAILTGLLLCILGLARAGGAIRFIPYPVIGGFLGATGWLMTSGAVRVMTDHGITLAEADALRAPANVGKIAASVLLALILYLGLRRYRSPYLLPGLLIAGILAAHLALVLTGTSLAEAQSAGWFFVPPAPAQLTWPWGGDEISQFPWHMLPRLSGELLAVMFVTAITLLLNTTGIEFVSRQDANLEQELRALGVANLLSGALGGYTSCMSLSRTTLNYELGGRGRFCGLIVALASVLMLAADPGFIAYVPKFIVGSLLIYTGASLMFTWLVDSGRRISPLEYVSVLAVTLIIIQFGFIAGVLIGVIIGCATFAVSASRVNAIKFSFDGSEYRSSLDRGPLELALLRAHGHQIQGMSLQSYLFFGSANRLYQQVKRLFVQNPDCRFLLFDFRLVTGLDSSAMHSFTQIKQAADELGARLVLVNLASELHNTFSARKFISPDVIVASDLDRALEACENAVIAAHAQSGGEARSLRDWFVQALGSDIYADQLASECKRLDVGEGTVIATQGAPPDCMHFILSGRVGIIVKMDEGRSVRVRSLGPFTTIGEMGLITKQPRSATIQAEVPSVLYALSTEAYERLKRENPPLSQALLTYIVTIMAERLSFASRVIGVLRR